MSSDIYEIIPDNDTNYWVYSLTDVRWNELLKSKKMMLGSVKDFGVEFGDVVFIYSKALRNSGFVGIARTSKSQKKNTKGVNIFKDKYQNSYMLELDYLKQFNTMINPNKILKFVKIDKPGYRNLPSFRSKFVKGCATFVKMEFKGDVFLEKFFEIVNLDKKFSESKTRFLKKRKILIIDESESESDQSDESDEVSEIMDESTESEDWVDSTSSSIPSDSIPSDSITSGSTTSSSKIKKKSKKGAKKNKSIIESSDTSSEIESGSWTTKSLDNQSNKESEESDSLKDRKSVV